jgi:hypothetical protein
VCRFMEIGFVTVLAGDSQRLVAHCRFTIPGFRRVTFRARDAGMGPAQSKSRSGVVIERNPLPRLRVMAGLTDRRSAPGELAEVRIFVTGGACRRDARVPHGIRPLVAFHALYGAVLPFKRKLRGTVIEEKRRPGSGDMA